MIKCPSLPKYLSHLTSLFVKKTRSHGSVDYDLRISSPSLGETDHIAEQQAQSGVFMYPVSPLAPLEFPTMLPVKGVKLASGDAGLYSHPRDNISIIHFDSGSVVAGCTTKSSTCSSAVNTCREKLEACRESDDHNNPVVFIVNSGGANAFTGQRGEVNTKVIIEEVAKSLKTSTQHVFPASTGIIGQQLPVNKIINTIHDIHSNLCSDGWYRAAKSIMTTDTYPKGSSCSVEISTGTITITGIAKGSGMIAPDMATLLAFIATDANISSNTLQSAVTSCVDNTFNCITVDSDTSTSDTVLVASTRKSCATEIQPDSNDYKIFSHALQNVMMELAHQVVRDGEGATKFIQIDVSGAAQNKICKKIALNIANSPLVKVAIAGEDPNWGRIIAALGKSGTHINRDAVKICLGPHEVILNGEVSPEYCEDSLKTYMKNQEICLYISVGQSRTHARVWTCDLTHQYITINSAYPT